MSPYVFLTIAILVLAVSVIINFIYLITKQKSLIQFPTSADSMYTYITG